jgi:large subunit ribosomal protein L6
MSRIGRKPIAVPSGVEVIVSENNFVTVKGPKGTLEQQLSEKMTITLENGQLTVTRPNDEKENKALHGLTRVLLSNMVIGVTEGFKKQLDFVGYKVSKATVDKKSAVSLGIGYSHPVYFFDGDGITFEVVSETTLVVHGIDKQKVGQVAANVRAKRPPEPYKGKGIRYTDEYVRRKAGKAGKK